MRLNNALKFYSGKRSSAWPPERRLKQSARMRAAKIWRRSTGPKTPSGKAKSAHNATKSGLYGAGWKALRRALALYRRFLKWATQALKLIRAGADEKIVLTTWYNERYKPPSINRNIRNVCSYSHWWKTV